MSLSLRQRRCLELMDIDVWVDRSAPAMPEAQPGAAATATRAQGSGKAAADIAGLDALRAEVSRCTRCALHQGRTQTVFGVGDPAADWMLIGEAPGAEEDKRGEPFVGRAGKLLNSMLEAIGLKRESVYICNILRCRPPQNRDPKPEEVAECEPYLHKTIRLVQPKIILALGRVAAQNLLKVETPIGKMRGQVYGFPDPKIPVLVTYHPAYLLRSPGEKRKVWDDLRLAMRIYKEQA